MSVVSISELRRALQNQKLDVEIIRCIARTHSPNVSNLADELGRDRKSIRFHLYKLKAEGYVTDHWAIVRVAFGHATRSHEWRLTQRGRRVLREGGLIFADPRL